MFYTVDETTYEFLFLLAMIVDNEHEQILASSTIHQMRLSVYKYLVNALFFCIYYGYLGQSDINALLLHTQEFGDELDDNILDRNEDIFQHLYPAMKNIFEPYICYSANYFAKTARSLLVFEKSPYIVKSDFHVAVTYFLIHSKLSFTVNNIISFTNGCFNPIKNCLESLHIQRIMLQLSLE